MTAEVAAKIWAAVVPDLPVSGWRSAAGFGRGLLAWADAIERSQTMSEEDFAAARADIASALHGDERNPVVHYNLGALLYERYQEGLTEAAIGHFTVAFSSSFHSDDVATLFVAGLSLTGLSLSYAQLYHRFARTSDEVLVNCRLTARRAVEMLTHLAQETGDPVFVPPLLRARHAEAFSLHVTEEPADIAAAIAIYETAIAGWVELEGSAPAVLWNNLGYQHMALEGRDEPGCDPEAYERAASLFRRALEVESDFEMAWANLGNVQRLLKRHAEAEQSYRRALAAAAAQGRKYPPAHIEMARVFLEQGRADEAEDEYRAALDLCESPAAAAKVHGEWADALRGVNQDRLAVAAARRGLSTWPGEQRCRSVLEKLQAEPSEPRGAAEHVNVASGPP
jgi:Tfp pilus assembly protein PilF